MVTALFADVVGSTALAESMDPEEWTAIMNRAFDRLIPKVYDYEGTVARLMGDAVLAFFGAPVAHEDDPQRATRAALDMIRTAREYAEEVRKTHGIEFALRVGLNTGSVVVGAVGSNNVYEYTAMGDAVNLAARMQSAAKPMTVLISEYTYRFIAPVFDVADLGEIDVKGKSEPVHVYEVQRPKTAPSSTRGLAGLVSPMVGRDKDLQTLLQVSAAVESGLGRVVLVVGEAGLGKSRLISEWQAESAIRSKGAQPLQWLEANCLSYGQGLAYHLLLDLLRACINVSATANISETYAALTTLTQDLFGDASIEVYPYLAHMFSPNLEGEAQTRVQHLDPQALQSQYLAALRKLLSAMGAQRPLGLIFEDIHWADPSSIELLTRLLTLATEAPILFCFVTRPDRDSHGWKLVNAARETLGAGLTEVLLAALSDEDSRRLISNLLEIEALPDRIRRIILEKAEGIPFFVEEVIRMLMDRGALIKQDNQWIAGEELNRVEIPDNLQGLLLARIDRLPEEAKHTLRVASVIGRQFPLRVLEQVLHEDAE
jgi:class 3 adenylate cyclase